MRKDMYKIIVERPRRGRHWPASPRPRVDPEFSAGFEGLRRRHVERKSLNENLRPLQRYLHAQVGRPWDKVYASICAGIDRRNTVQQHIHQHLADFVALKVVDVDGTWCFNGRWGRMERLSSIWAPGLYVDPCTGLLQINREQRRQRQRDRRNVAAESPQRIDIAPMRQLHRVQGCWYEITLATVEDGEREQPLPFCAMRGRQLGDCPARENRRGVASNHTLFGRADVYAKQKRQLGARELQRRGLSNGLAANECEQAGQDTQWKTAMTKRLRL